MENKQRHLEMILRIVDRLSTNSFLLKGWSVVLVSALFALAAKDTKLVFVYLCYFPAFAFWGLDGYFLWQERLYRQLYESVRAKPEEDIDFSMDTFGVRGQVKSWVETCFSKTLVAFHGTLTATIVLVMILMA
jgi:hypothetical protein